MREEMTQRINVCFDGLIATVASTPCRAKSETHLHAMIGSSMSHLSAQPCTEGGFSLSDHVRPQPTSICEPCDNMIPDAVELGAHVAN